MNSSPVFDLVIRGGTVVNASGRFVGDVGLREGRIAALGLGLGPGREEVDAAGHFVMPGGIDSHVHIEQVSAGGLLNADTFESATRSAAFGGTTTVICFAAQHRGLVLREVVAEHEARGARGALIDYAFHMIVANPDARTLGEDLPALIEAGHSSIKVFMTYDLIKVDDEPLLDLLLLARSKGAMVCVHAENHGFISWMSKRLVEKGYRAPKYHAMSHPRASEAEAFNRLIAASALIDQPVMIFHVSTAEGAAVIREARGQGLKIFAETCPQYLFLTKEDLDRPGFEGAKFMCSPPLRDGADQEALWRALALGDIQTVTSDHAPYRYDETGKFSAGPDPSFKQIANGMPGLEVRLPLLFDAMISRGRPEFAGREAEAFVELTAARPAQIYNLAAKGAIAPGMDADITIWDPLKKTTIRQNKMHDNMDFTPYEGREIQGWPARVYSRGREVVRGDDCLAAPGSGHLIRRAGGAAARPAGILAPEMDPARNFGAELLPAPPRAL